MNRLQSMLAAGLTTALSAGALGAFSSAQGLFDSGTTQAAEETVTQAETWPAPATVAIPVASAATPQVIYKDLEPIVVTRQVFTTADASPSAEAASNPTESATPSSSPSASPSSSPATPALPAVESTPVPAPQAPPVFALAPEASPSASASGTFDDNGGDRDDSWDDDEWDDHDDDDWDDDDEDDDEDDDRDHEDEHEEDEDDDD